LGWVYILLATGILLFVSFLETPEDRAWTSWGFFVSGLLCLIAAIGLMAFFGLEYLRKHVSCRKSSKSQIKFLFEDSTISLHADARKLVEVDHGYVDYVSIINSRGSFLGIRAGFGIRFENIESVSCDQEHRRKTMKQTLQAKGFHLWMPSAYVGSQAQNEELRSWLFTTPLADRIREIEAEPVRLVGWNRESWFILAFVTFGLIGAIIYYLM
jgi:hypothetical protein